MTGREKPKRKALHRGLDDTVTRDASLPSNLLGRVKPRAREPLEVQAGGEESPGADAEAVAPPVKLRPRAQGEAAEVRRLDEARAETRPPISGVETSEA